MMAGRMASERGSPPRTGQKRRQACTRAANQTVVLAKRGVPTEDMRIIAAHVETFAKVASCSMSPVTCWTPAMIGDERLCFDPRAPTGAEGSR
jgi:hypothetical protein